MLNLRSTDALLVIDMQNDFLPGGTLAVAGGDDLLSGINALTQRFDHIVVTQDWHPTGHISFASTHSGKQAFVDTVAAPYGPQALWPDHCLQGSEGAALAPALDTSRVELVLRKGFRQGIDSYSAFVENDKTTLTGLAGFLRERGLTRLFFCGLAYDFCVGHSALDAVRLGFEAVVVEDLSRAVDLPAAADTPSAPGSVARIEAAFAEMNVRRFNSADLLAADGAAR